MQYAHLVPGDPRHAVDLLSRKITTQSATQVDAANDDVKLTDGNRCEANGSGEGDGARIHLRSVAASFGQYLWSYGEILSETRTSSSNLAWITT
jgi:hypothetical protein